MESKKQISLMFDLNEQMENWMPPWSVWSDEDINAERWEPVKGRHARIGSQDFVPSFVDPLGHCALPLSVASQVETFEEIRIDRLIAPKEVDHSLTLVYNGPSKALISITEAVNILIKINSTSPVPIIEMTGNDFIPQSSTWKPWHHIYAGCKVGKNTIHKPVTNGLGKYFVRLFYMGHWRRIPVDRWLPVQNDGSWVLPTHGPHLWPQLLTKALLKIGALTWTEEDELNGWNPLVCLTAWCPLSLNCANLAPVNLWKIFLKLLSKSNDVVDSHHELLVEDLKLFDTGVPLPMYDTLKDASKKVEKFSQMNPKHERLGPVSVLADLDEVGTVLLLNVDLTMDPNAEYPRPPTPQWKKFRWKDWAKAKGLLYERSLPTIRSVKLYSPKVMHLSEDVLMKIVEPTIKVKGRDKPRKTAQVPGVEVFASFEALCNCIKQMHIYLRPSSFQQSLCINNLSDVLSQCDEDSPAVTYRIYRKLSSLHSSLNTLQTLTRTRVSSSVFVLFDSDCTKSLFLSLSYIADSTIDKCEHRYQLGGHSMNADVRSPVSILAQPYDWKLQLTTEPIHLDLNPTVLHMDVGMVVLQLWFGHPQQQISLLLASQTPFLLGSRETVLEKMSEGSCSLRQYASDLSKSLNNLAYKLLCQHSHEEALEAFHASYLPPCLKTPKTQFDKPLAISLKSRLPDALVACAKLYGQRDIGKQVSFLMECENLIIDVVIERHHLTAEQRSKWEIKSLISSTSEIRQRKSKQELTKKPTHVLQFFDDLHFGIFFLKHMLMSDLNLLNRYPFRNDFNSLVYFTEYKGVQRVDPFQKWIPLFQVTLNHCLCLETRTLCAVQLFTPAPLWELKVVDDNTGNILPNVLREPVPFYFVKGNTYTVLGYCWVGADAVKEIPWMLRILGTGVESVPHSCELKNERYCHTQSPKMLQVQELVDYYLPNKYNIACKALIKYEATVTLIVRLALSCRGAKFIAKFTKGEEVTHEFRGVGDLVVPSVTLVHSGREGSVELCVLEMVLVDGWELSRPQREAIPAVAQRMRRRRLVFEGAYDSGDLASSLSLLLGSSRRRSGAVGVRNKASASGALFSLKCPCEVIANAPTFTVDVAHDPAFTNIVRLGMDDRDLEELRQSKLEREVKFPGRHAKGVQLRENFIRQHKGSFENLDPIPDRNLSNSTISELAHTESGTKKSSDSIRQTTSFFAKMKEQEMSMSKTGEFMDNVVLGGLNEVQDAFDKEVDVNNKDSTISELALTDLGTKKSSESTSRTKSVFTKMKENEMYVYKVGEFMDNVVLEGLNEVQDAFDKEVNVKNNNYTISELAYTKSGSKKSSDSIRQTKSFFPKMKEQKMSMSKIGELTDNVVLGGLNEVQDAFDKEINVNNKNSTISELAHTKSGSKKSSDSIRQTKSLFTKMKKQEMSMSKIGELMDNVVLGGLNEVQGGFVKEVNVKNKDSTISELAHTESGSKISSDSIRQTKSFFTKMKEP